MVNLMFVQCSQKTEGGRSQPIVNLANVDFISKYNNENNSSIMFNDVASWVYDNKKDRDVDYNRIMRKLGLMSGSVAGD